jgi:hypothetical protein
MIYTKSVTINNDDLIYVYSNIISSINSDIHKARLGRLINDTFSNSLLCDDFSNTQKCIVNIVHTICVYNPPNDHPHIQITTVVKCFDSFSPKTTPFLEKYYRTERCDFYCVNKMYDIFINILENKGV